jgi:hypothetical protein
MIILTQSDATQSLYTGFKIIGCLMCLSALPAAAQGYAANTAKLSNQAGQSKDLYVEPDFDFRTYKNILLDLSVTDAQGDGVGGVMLMLFAVDEDSEDDKASTEQSQTKRALISIVRTDSSGRVYKQIEMSNSTQAVQIELNRQTANNTVTMQMQDSVHISHGFELD